MGGALGVLGGCLGGALEHNGTDRQTDGQTFEFLGLLLEPKRYLWLSGL